METDPQDGSSGSTTGTKENGFHLYPVSQHDSGVGLPYAPEDFPSPGDKWGWKVGRRIAASGNFLDRYLYLPTRLHKEHKAGGFASKLSVQRFVMTEFPGTDVDAFFASFSWKIPSKKVEDDIEVPTPASGNAGNDSQVAIDCCKAGNSTCSSLVETGNPPPSDVMPCSVCCSEPDFCRHCCCILCCRVFNAASGGYDFIRCEAMVSEGFICGHGVHIECGLRSYMAGTVGGSIGLDAEYYCRRCDTRTDLVPHVMKVFQTCESIDSQHDIEKILNICVSALRGSSKINAKRLLHHIELATTKLKNGISHEDIWNVEDLSAITTDFSQHETDQMEISNYDEPLHWKTVSPQILSGDFDYRIESLKLEDEIDQILVALKKSQESEYKIAEESLNAQKNHLLDLYQQLEKERRDLAERSPSSDPDDLLDAVLKRVDQIKQEVVKLRNMGAVAKGFGKTSKAILKEHFSVKMVED